MIILAMDQAIIKSGYAVVDSGKLIDYGTIDGSKFKDMLPEKRRNLVRGELEDLISKHNPNTIIIEDTQFQNNVGVLKDLTALKTTLEDWLWNNKINYLVATPSQWRKPFGFKGRKRVELKEQSIKLIKDKFGIDATDDEADAILMALYVWEMNKK